MQVLHKTYLDRSSEGQEKCKAGIDYRLTRSHETEFQNSEYEDKSHHDAIKKKVKAYGIR
jgi:hypothetical protein